MRRDLAEAASETHDVLVIGGGVYGACAALLATAAGHRVALVEKSDFGSGTSFNSLRIIHGGLRYLQRLDIGRMRESIRARRSWSRFAPELLSPMDFVMPTYGVGTRGPMALRAALWLTELVGWDRNDGVDSSVRLGRGGLLSRREAARVLEGFRVRPGGAAARWPDLLCLDSERLILEVLGAASRAGAKIANYAPATGLIREEDCVVGASVIDREAGAHHELRARHVVNAAGPGAVELLDSVGAAGPEDERPLYSRAFNLVLRGRRGPCAIGFPAGPPGQRPEPGTYFMVPWNGVTLVGTKHLQDYARSPGRRMDPEPVLGFLNEINEHLVEGRFAPADVIAVLAGWLPEAKRSRGEGEPAPAPHSLVIDHAVRDGLRGLTTVIGVKWTTAPEVARRVVRSLGPPSERPPEGRGWLPSFEDCRRPDLAREDFVAARRRRSPAAASRIVPDRSARAADVEWAAKSEMARTLSDVVLRRTDLWLSTELDEAALEHCARLMSTERRWDASAMRAQVRETMTTLEAGP